jgi:hypothetical protein
MIGGGPGPRAVSTADGRNPSKLFASTLPKDAVRELGGLGKGVLSHRGGLYSFNRFKMKIIS